MSQQTATTVDATPAAEIAVSSPAKSALRLHASWIAICIVLFGVSYRWSRSVVTPPRARNLLAIPKEKLNFGTVLATDKFTWKVPVKNQSTETIDIERIEVSCGCTSVEPNHFSLAPNETKEIIFEIALKSRDGAAGTDFSVGFKPIFKHHETVFNDAWEITGSVKSVIELGVSSILYDANTRMISGETPNPTTIPIQLHVPEIRVKCSCAEKIGKIEPVETLPKKLVVNFVPSQTLSPGLHTGTVDIEVEDSGGASLSKHTIPISLRVVGMVEVTPRILELGVHKVGAIAEGKVYLSSTGDKPFQIGYEPKEKRAIRIVSEAGNATSQEVNISLDVTKTGRHELREQILVVDEAGNEERVEIRLQYSGE